MAGPQSKTIMNGRPLRLVIEVRMMPTGRGHTRVFKLACGHTVERLGCANVRPYDRMGCPHCR